MINPFKAGDTKEFRKVVSVNDTATFDSGEVHPVYATFALGRDAEWACRLFVLEMKEADEEGIGTYLNITHHAPALLEEEVIFTSVLKEVAAHAVICTFTARVGSRMIATGETGQKILKKEKLEKLFRNLV